MFKKINLRTSYLGILIDKEYESIWLETFIEFKNAKFMPKKEEGHISLLGAHTGKYNWR